MSSNLFTITGTTPASASTAVGAVVSGLDRFDAFSIDADLIGATGGVLDVYLQRKITDNVWRDWLHFTQLTAGNAAVRYSVSTSPGIANTIVAVGTGTDSAATPALAANTFIGGHPGNFVRAVYVAGASTSAGAAVSILIRGWNRRV